MGPKTKNLQITLNLQVLHLLILYFAEEEGLLSVIPYGGAQSKSQVRFAHHSSRSSGAWRSSGCQQKTPAKPGPVILIAEEEGVIFIRQQPRSQFLICFSKSWLRSGERNSKFKTDRQSLVISNIQKANRIMKYQNSTRSILDEENPC